MARALAEEIRREKARGLRFKKPMMYMLNYDSMLEWLYDAQEKCEEWAWLDENNREQLLDALDGNDEEYTAYQMSFSLLAGDLNSMYDDLNADELPECFNDIMCGCGADAADDVLGFDEYENDYFGLNSIETKWAIDEAHKRLERMTKKQLMDMYTMCSRIAFQFMALRYRMDELDAAINILKSLNGEILRDVKSLCSLYDELEEHPNDWKLIEKFDAAAQMLPEEAWLR